MRTTRSDNDKFIRAADVVGPSEFNEGPIAATVARWKVEPLGPDWLRGPHLTPWAYGPGYHAGHAQIADQHVKLLLRAEIDGRLKIERRLHMIAAPTKQIRKRAICIFVILNKENSQRLPLRLRW